MTNANVVTWAGRSIYNTFLTGSLQVNYAYVANTPKYVFWGTANGGTDTGSAFSDVNLFTPANGTSYTTRSTCVYTLLQANQGADTAQFVGTLTANGVLAVYEVGLFDSATVSAQATLNSTAIASGATTTIGVANTVAMTLPTTNGYYLQVDNECMCVTGGAGSNTLTVVRGALGSTAAAHAASIQVTCGGDGGAFASNSTITANGTAGHCNTNMALTNGGSMFVHADFPVINLANNDSIAFTLKVQLS